MAENNGTKYIFLAGGVMSGVGKGVAASSIGKILQSRGYDVTALKIDPYVNVDAGTMNPTEHGEVFVLDDGVETDQDMGNYERFLNTDLSTTNYMTTGSIYQRVIEKERSMEYGGRCVEVVPDIPLQAISQINQAVEKTNSEIAIVEIGGTVGEYQNVLFLEAVRILRRDYPDDVLLGLVSFLPQLGGENGELKTKPTQNAVRALNSTGLQPDFVLGRANQSLDDKRRQKISFHCNVEEEHVISAPDVDSIYKVPVNFEKEDLGPKLLNQLGLEENESDMGDWRNLVERIENLEDEVKIGIVGKYFNTGEFVLKDSYISVIESIKHASYEHNLEPNVEWIYASEFNPKQQDAWQENLKDLDEYDGLIVPGGFGGRDTEGKIQAIRYARENKIPFLGLCYGLQLAVVEYARNVVGLEDAHTTEADDDTPHPVIDILPEQKENISEGDYGATMRLGAYPADLRQDTIAYASYGSDRISERHRHRYEVNPEYIERMEEAGFVFSGKSPNERLMEIGELPTNKHPFFVGTQFHPEFKSRPLRPSPIFLSFIGVASGKQDFNELQYGHEKEDQRAKTSK